MKTIDIYEVTKKLIGNIEPIGESNYDREVTINLNNTIELTKSLISDIINISKLKDRGEHSIKLCGEMADNFLEELFNDVKNIKLEEVMTDKEIEEFINPLRP